MNYFDLGLHEDLAGNYKGAIEYYSKSVDNEELILDVHLNLTVILILSAVDFGVSSYLLNSRIFSRSELSNLYEYLEGLLKKNRLSFNSGEINFWDYFRSNYYTGFSREKILRIIESDKSSLVPYFQLYIDDLAERRPIEYLFQIEKLKQHLGANMTIKNKYIISLIESAERHNAQNA